MYGFSWLTMLLCGICHIFGQTINRLRNRPQGLIDPYFPNHGKINKGSRRGGISWVIYPQLPPLHQTLIDWVDPIYDGITSDIC